ncbi:MAG: DUF6037 family protein [Erysipelotrichaceae bacterium]
MLKLNNLESFHNDILKNNKTYGVFDYTHNSIDFNILFDIVKIPFKLYLIKKNNGESIDLDVDSEYRIDTYLGDRLKTLRSMLELSNGKSSFKTNDFFNEFNKKIPSQLSQCPIKQIYLQSIYNYEDSELVYFKCLIDWDKNTVSNKHFTAANREKTRILYPQIYEYIKDKNISVVYTDQESESNLHHFEASIHFKKK